LLEILGDVRRLAVEVQKPSTKITVTNASGSSSAAQLPSACPALSVAG
jgi:hypothetical protein